MAVRLPFRRMRGLGRGRRFRLPIAAVLVGGFGTLMLIAVAGVLAIGLFSGTRNTYSLLGDKADLVLASVELRIRHQLEPARAMAGFVAGLIERGELDPGDRGRLVDTLRGALAAVPDVSGAGFVGADRRGLRVRRTAAGIAVTDVDLADPEAPWVGLDDTAARTRPEWLGPIRSRAPATTVLFLLHPVRVDGRYVGQVAVGVTLVDLSRFLSGFFVDQGFNAFVLLGDGHVLAHPSLSAGGSVPPDRPGEPPLPRLDEVGDPPLAALWSTEVAFRVEPRRIEGRDVSVDGEDYLFLLRRMGGYGPTEWTVGVVVRDRDINQELRRLDITAAAGIGILLLSVGVSLFVGRRISRQIGQLADAADRVRGFDFRDVRELPDSRLSEVARAATAFNAMIAGLRWFETYVPKSLVLRLMRRRTAAGGFASEERVVTVMFTDIRGFTRMAEHLGAAETAALLNDHFTLLADCIEAEGGTVDKFIGDAIMAFWGAPDDQTDHAARALRAAAAIAGAVREDNARRTASGAAPIRVRIGIHSGPVVVGNIGSASRINYTIVGDTVNVAARIEELASALQADREEIIILTSDTTRDLAGAAVPLDSVGERPLRGRSAVCAVWRFAPAADGETEAASDRSSALLAAADQASTSRSE